MSKNRSFYLEKEIKATIVLDAVASGYCAIHDPGSEPTSFLTLSAGETYTVGPNNLGHCYTLHLHKGDASLSFSYDGLNKEQIDALNAEEVGYANTELGADNVDEALDELAERCNATKGPDITTTGTGTYTIDSANGIYQKITIAHDITLAFTFPSSQVSGLCLEIVNGGAHTVTWPAAMRFAGKTEPVLTASGSDILAIFTDGTTQNCSVTATDIGVPA